MGEAKTRRLAGAPARPAVRARLQAVIDGHDQKRSADRAGPAVRADQQGERIAAAGEGHDDRSRRGGIEPAVEDGAAQLGDRVVIIQTRSSRQMAHQLHWACARASMAPLLTLGCAAG